MASSAKNNGSHQVNKRSKQYNLPFDSNTHNNRISPDVIMYFFQDTLINHLEISVSEAEKRANSSLNIRDYYTVYLIETKYVSLR